MDEGAVGEIVVRVGDNHAIVLSPKGEAALPYGRSIADLNLTEVANVAAAARAGVVGAIEAQKYAGKLVEIDQASRVLIGQAKQVEEAGGWIQAALRRDGGQIAHIVRIRPAAAAQLAAAGVNIVGAVAAQAAAAQLAADVKNILKRVEAIQEYHANKDRAALRTLVGDVADLLEITRSGTNDRTGSEALALARQLRQVREESLLQLEHSVTKLKGVYRYPSTARKELTDARIGDISELWGHALIAHAANAEAEYLVIADEYRLGRSDQAVARADRVSQRSAEVEQRFKAVAERIAEVEKAALDTYKPMRQRLGFAGPAGGGAAAAGMVAARALPFVNPIAGAAGIPVMGAFGVHALVQDQVFKDVKKVVGRLEEGINADAPGLELSPRFAALSQAMRGWELGAASEEPQSQAAQLEGGCESGATSRESHGQ